MVCRRREKRTMTVGQGRRAVGQRRRWRRIRSARSGGVETLEQILESDVDAAHLTPRQRRRRRGDGRIVGRRRSYRLCGSSLLVYACHAAEDQHEDDSDSEDRQQSEREQEHSKIKLIHLMPTLTHNTTEFRTSEAG